MDDIARKIYEKVLNESGEKDALSAVINMLDVLLNQDKVLKDFYKVIYELNEESPS